MIPNDPGIDRETAGFMNLVVAALQGAKNRFDLKAVELVDGEPTIVYRTRQEEMDSAVDEIRYVSGIAVGVFTKSDTGPDSVTLVALPPEGASGEYATWSVKREWADAYDRGQMSDGEFVSKLQDSFNRHPPA